MQSALAAEQMLAALSASMMHMADAVEVLAQEKADRAGGGGSQRRVLETRHKSGPEFGGVVYARLTTWPTTSW